MKGKEKEFFSFDTETRQGGAFIVSTFGKGKALTYRIKNKNDVTQFLRKVWHKKFGNIGFAYNLDYDTIALLKHFGDRVIMELYLHKEVFIGGLKIGYIPKKFLYIQRGKRITYIFELMQYFNMSLDAAAKKYLGVGKMDIGGKEVKKNIWQYFLKNPKRIIKYCEMDAQRTTELAEKLDSMVVKFGLSIEKYYSCGYIAKSYLKTKNIRYQPLRDEKIIELVKPAYFGGRIEFLKRGWFNKLYQYDINSAYPFACSKLENIVEYRKGKRIDPRAKYFFVDCEIHISQKDFSPLAFRNGNLIIYPSGTIRQRVDNFTYETLLREGAIRKVYDCLNVYTDGTRPFEKMITTLYKRRMVSDEDEKYIIKIILNSLYGKFAEKRKDYIQLEEDEALMMLDLRAGGKKGFTVLETEIGYFTRKVEYSRHSNLMYASLITSYVRRLMYECMRATGSQNVVGGMTDCIFSKVPIPKKYISESKELGMFSLKESGSCYVIGSGVYGSDTGSKLRGYNIKTDLRELAKQNKGKDHLTIRSTERKGSGKLVVQGLDILHLNEISDTDKVLNLNFDHKREWAGGFKNFGESLSKSITSETIEINMP